MILKKISKYFTKKSQRRFVSHFNLTSASSVLDISCGNGGVLSLYKQYSEAKNLYGIDMREECIIKAKEKYSWGTFSCVEAEELPFRNAFFTIVVSCAAVHHYKNVKKVFEEVSRVLLPLGDFYIVDIIPNFRWSQILHNLHGCGEPYHFEKYYTLKDLEYIAKHTGFYLVKNILSQPVSFPGVRVLVFRKTDDY